MRSRTAIALALVFLAIPVVRAQEEPLANKVRKSIQDGVKYLRGLENGKGSFESAAGVIAEVRPGGITSLCVVALLNSGVPPDDPLIQRCLKYLRTVNPTQTYTVGLQTMAYCLAGHKQDRQLVLRNLDWLKDNRVSGGWGYDANMRSPDHSINQYALLGIHEARQAGFDIDEKMLQAMYDHYKDNTSGQWTYRNRGGPTLTMTTAGLCNLLITGQDLQRKKKLQADGSDPTCGEYSDIPPVRNALNWIGAIYPANVSKNPINHPFYALYGIERAGRLTGRRFFGDHDWYRVGCEYLVSIQQANGSWKGQGGFDYWEPVATSFSLLFLSKGRTPVLISKLAHGADGRNVEPWNLKRSDVRNITDFASNELFDKQPLAWQVFDTRQIRNRKAVELAEELLQSPILYISGHDLLNVIDQRDEDMLKEFVSNGGFIFAEACCNANGNGKNFDKNFRDLMERVTGSRPAPLGRDHPVWRASGKFPVAPGSYELEGIQQGCKTVVIYSPKAISGWWENNDVKSDEGKQAFHMAANVIAYATGLEKPKDRLFPVEISREIEGKKAPRGYLQVAQLVRDRDTLPLAPKAIPNLMAEVNKSQLEVHQQAKIVTLTAPDVLQFRFFYMHDRTGFVPPKAEALEDLKLALETRGILLADAACGSENFDKSFRALCKQLFPDKELQKIDVAAEQKAGGLYSREVNGFMIQTVMCRQKDADGRPTPKAVEGPPQLEGIKIGGRWAVIYSKYDIGCALERHQSPDCLGHDYDSAKTLARAVVLYAMRQ